MARMNLGVVEVLLHSQNRNMAMLQKTALTAFNFKKIATTRNHAQLTESARLSVNDIIILNHHSDENLEETISFLRAGEDIANPYAVIIVVTPHASRKFIRDALRMGVDGVVGLPFSAQDLWRQLSFFINTQRTFLRTTNYFGPDRRRLKGIDYGGDERRCGAEFDEDHKVADRSRTGLAA